jgi:hypothetical protein
MLRLAELSGYSVIEKPNSNAACLVCTYSVTLFMKVVPAASTDIAQRRYCIVYTVSL